MAVAQEHKESTPVRPVLDYRQLNELIVSNPGNDAPVCQDKLRRWRKGDESAEYSILDIRKAYLQVKVAPDLLRYQVVLWKGKKYVMTRMGFGLAIAPKFMDIVVKWATRDFPNVDNYVDDLRVPSAETDTVSSALLSYDLPTKEAEKMESARVLGLQLYRDNDGQLRWKRRNPARLECPDKVTKRAVFAWCGALTSHYPVVSWLRPACSFLKRLAASDVNHWDDEVSSSVVLCCAELADHLAAKDPATGPWKVPPSSESEWVLYCDASDVAIGVVLEVNGVIVEDACWLRSVDDKKHINVAELEAVVKGLNLAVQWDATNVNIVTDSKTVHGWLSSVISNSHRVKTSGLYSVMVQRRLEIATDLLSSMSMSV